MIFRLMTWREMLEMPRSAKTALKKSDNGFSFSVACFSMVNLPGVSAIDGNISCLSACEQRRKGSSNGRVKPVQPG